MTRGAIVAVALASSLVAAGCSEPQQSPAVAREIASSRDILVDLARWDAATTASRRAAAEDVARRLPDFALLRLETFSCGGQRHEVAVYAHAKTGMEFVLVPGGTFVMGSPPGEAGRAMDEAPETVTLTHSFLIARTDCTNETYGAVAGGATLPKLDVRGPSPVSMSWGEAKKFCDTTGLELPTEAQWERACRAGTTTAWSFGNDSRLLGEFAWHAGNSSGPRQPVGVKKPNAFGLFDMHGNEWQWCEGQPGGGSSGTSMAPAASLSRTSHVLRGGSCREEATHTRSAYRCWFTYGERAVDDSATFRPAKTVPTE